ncbi:hypothetical protein [Glycomyces algeriensis]|uniref:Uncharacterized protein n=1 Tax=Glycomyces algeriensis TaxID=256037 RepID=A0A9W6G8Q5_9ACTN|nr:hypothetical protein [Glycomyces algeriensis]MDA1364623.1 hypothetical protein [Glycomyces algeriensis]MDR7350660.1 hypothetical protein [Glycomyces algeriensis]GLI43369.1 hypothetical protein GALLR39Z86_32190 [Glycomyces algeriensis]
MPTEPPGSALDAAIDRLYAAFGTVPRPAAIELCPCCMTESEAAALVVRVPLRELRVAVLEPYVADVLLTVGSVADFRYFLPRIYAIACTSGFDWPELEPLFRRLRVAGWTDWAAEEQAAIRDLLRAFWSLTLAAGDRDADTVLCAIGNAEDDLGPYLDEWAAHLRHPVAAAELRDLLRHGARLKRGAMRLTNAFWGSRGAQVVQWLTGIAVRTAVAEAFATADSEASLQSLAEIEDLLAVYGR